MKNFQHYLEMIQEGENLPQSEQEIIKKIIKIISQNLEFLPAENVKELAYLLNDLEPFMNNSDKIILGNIRSIIKKSQASWGGSDWNYSPMPKNLVEKLKIEIEKLSIVKSNMAS